MHGNDLVGWGRRIIESYLGWDEIVCVLIKKLLFSTLLPQAAGPGAALQQRALVEHARFGNGFR